MLRIVYISIEIYPKYYAFLSPNLHQKLKLFQKSKNFKQDKQTQFTFKSIALMESIDHFLFTPDQIFIICFFNTIDLVP